jgi:hypothetical protein
VLHPILPDTQLLEVAGVWTLYYKGRQYMRLLDASSRKDAEDMITELLLNAAQNAKRRTEQVMEGVYAAP